MTVNDPSLVVSINDDLIILVGTPHDFSLRTTNPDHKKLVQYYMEHSDYVSLNPAVPSWKFSTGNSSLITLLAAMVAVDPSKAVIREAPEEVWVEIEENYN